MLAEMLNVDPLHWWEAHIQDIWWQALTISCKTDWTLMEYCLGRWTALSIGYTGLLYFPSCCTDVRCESSLPVQREEHRHSPIAWKGCSKSYTGNVEDSDCVEHCSNPHVTQGRISWQAKDWTSFHGRSKFQILNLSSFHQQPVPAD